jgi:hypothetical protein
MRDSRLVDRSRKLSRESVCSTEGLTLRLFPRQRFSREPHSAVVTHHQSPTVFASCEVPSALDKVYLVFCNLSKGNVRYAHEDVATRQQGIGRRPTSFPLPAKAGSFPEVSL